MDHYITGTAIKALRERCGLTQTQLADQLCVSDKTVSKWETGRGLPDITLLEPLAAALHVSLPELLSGEVITNANRSANLLRSRLYVCPVCGNILPATGAAGISCCGIALPPLEAEAPDDAHTAAVTEIEHELYVEIPHEMTKTHYISFIVYVTGDRFELVRLYPEGPAAARFFRRGHGKLYWYCNKHGLFEQKV